MFSFKILISAPNLHFFIIRVYGTVFSTCLVSISAHSPLRNAFTTVERLDLVLVAGFPSSSALNDFAIICLYYAALSTCLLNLSALHSIQCRSQKLTLAFRCAAGEIYKQLSYLDRFLFVWILLVMGLALLIGYYVKSIKDRLQVIKVAEVSLPIAIGLWVMMYPVLCKVKYELLFRMLKSGQLGKNLVLSLVLNWVVGPALMTGLAWATLPDLPHYRTGLILIGIARCIAMVLIWNELAKGDSQLCAILVAVNSILQIALFTPVSLFYLKVVSRGNGADVGAWTVAKSVLLFLGVPLAAGFLTRVVLRKAVGAKWYDTKFLRFIGPWALIGLLYTIFVMFSIQAHQIVHNIGDVARVVVPMLLYFSITFASSLAVCRYLRLPYDQLVTQSFTAASNNFELAIAVAVGAFGIDSQEALAATIGPLIEVPVLLVLVYVTLYFRKWLSPKPKA